MYSYVAVESRVNAPCFLTIQDTSGKDNSMNRLGMLLLLGLLLAGFLVLSLWLHTSHPTAPAWQTAIDRELAQVD